MSIAIVAAQSENRVIGRGSEIPWRVKGEQALFKQITMGGTLIMGRKTYEAIGRPLPGRQTIIVSRDKAYRAEGCITADSLASAITRAEAMGQPIFIAGGGDIYRQAIDTADALHLTTIHTETEGDIFFPEVPEEFELRQEQAFTSNIDYTYRYFERS